MEKSQSIINIAKALSQFQAKMGKVVKDSTNPYFNKKYLSLSGLLEAVKEPLQQSGLSISQFPTGQNGLTSILMHGESGEYLSADYFMNPSKADPQAQGSAITYMRRYALAAILLLNIEEDDDANEATHGGDRMKELARNNSAGGDNAKPLLSNSDKPWLNQDSKVYEKIIQRIKNKTTTMEQIAQHFKLSKQVRSSIQAVINSVAYSDN